MKRNLFYSVVATPVFLTTAFFMNTASAVTICDSSEANSTVTTTDNATFCQNLGFTTPCSDCGEKSKLPCPQDSTNCFCPDVDCGNKIYNCANIDGAAGGVGTACQGKYASCSCVTPKVFNTAGSGSCTCPVGYKYNCSSLGASGVGTACNGLYSSCTCASPKVFSATGSGSCTCPAEYKYSCDSVAGASGGVGTACDGKYTSCVCPTPGVWDGNGDGACCGSEYQYTDATCAAQGPHRVGAGTPCGGKYASCTCGGTWTWDGVNGKTVPYEATDTGHCFACQSDHIEGWSSNDPYYIALTAVCATDPAPQYVRFWLYVTINNATYTMTCLARAHDENPGFYSCWTGTNGINMFSSGASSVNLRIAPFSYDYPNYLSDAQ